LVRPVDGCRYPGRRWRPKPTRKAIIIVIIRRTVVWRLVPRHLRNARSRRRYAGTTVLGGLQGTVLGRPTFLRDLGRTAGILLVLIRNKSWCGVSTRSRWQVKPV
jgi:hypothetical protein